MGETVLLSLGLVVDYLLEFLEVDLFQGRLTRDLFLQDAVD